MVQPIRTEEAYAAALARIEALWGASAGTPEGDELDLWMVLVEAYEREQVHVPPPDPIEAIRFRAEQMGLSTDAALARALGWTRGRLSEILHRKRPLTLKQIRELARLEIPVEVLIAEYELAS